MKNCSNDVTIPKTSSHYSYYSRKPEKDINNPSKDGDSLFLRHDLILFYQVYRYL